MYIKYRYEEEIRLLHLPETATWEICCGWLEESLCLYVELDEEIIELSSMDDADVLNMSSDGIEVLYMAVVNEIAELIKIKPTAAFVDIVEIEHKLIERNKSEWRHAGYVPD